MIQRLKQILWDMEWAVAVRPHKKEGTFDTPMKFHVLRNTWRYWCADPFVFDHKGKTYIFMEVLDMLFQKGAIGYRVIENGKIGPIRVCLKMPHHMSYPMIYTQGEDIFMIPECHESEKMTIYRAKVFPDIWEPADVPLEGKKVCDTNYIMHEGNEYLLTMPISGSKYRYDTLELYRKEADHTWSLCPVGPLVIGEESARNAGHFLRHNGHLIRPSQNCGSSYGEKLVLNRVAKIAPDEYQEEIWKEITIEDIQLDRGRYDGIHTFNCSESYDVIDLRKKICFQPLKAVYWFVSKMKKVR